jgi:hypothetical protein
VRTLLQRQRNGACRASLLDGQAEELTPWGPKAARRLLRSVRDLVSCCLASRNATSPSSRAISGICFTSVRFTTRGDADNLQGQHDGTAHAPTRHISAVTMSSIAAAGLCLGTFTEDMFEEAQISVTRITAPARRSTGAQRL